jgi:spore coat protein I
MEKIAQRRKSNFDYIYLEYCNYFYEMGKDALDYILSPIYDKLVNETKNCKSICHNDLTHNNIIFNDSGEFLINFDFCSYDLKVYDLANFIRRRMRKCNWDICEAKIITDEYRRVNELTAEDFYVMKIMLQFPQKFWRVANKYYNSSRSWAQRVLIDKLDDVINEIECHKKFLKDYEIII